MNSPENTTGQKPFAVPYQLVFPVSFTITAKIDIIDLNRLSIHQMGRIVIFHGKTMKGCCLGFLMHLFKRRLSVLRLRNVPGARELLQSNAHFILEPENLKGKWSEYFGNTHPIHIEIGSGKGKFITTLAKQNDNINFIAIEKFATVLLKLIKKIPEEGLPNLAVLNADAEMLTQFFEPGEISKIYLNFSDPWPRKRHTKRRLTHIRFLETFKTLLKDDGIIAFKTDSRDLFDFSVEQFELAGYLLEDITYDLHQSHLAERNVTTEYEERFVSQGMPIYALTAYKNNL